MVETQTEVAVKITIQNFPAVEKDLPTDTTVQEIREIVRKELSRTTPVVPPLRYLFRGRSLPESTTLADLEPNIDENTLLEFFGVENNVEKTPAYIRLNNVRLLHRNVHECVKCAKHQINSRERIRYNDPYTPTSPRPTTADLGSTLKDIGVTFVEMSGAMKKMSKLLKKDEQIKSDEDYELKRRAIQNVMDAVRYSNPMLLNLTKLRIPINRPRAALQVSESNN